MSNIEHTEDSASKSSSKKKAKKLPQGGNEVPRSEGTSGVENTTSNGLSGNAPENDTTQQSELSTFGSMLTNSMLTLQTTLTQQFEKLQNTIERTWSTEENNLLASSEGEYRSESDNENGAKTNDRALCDKPRSKRQRDASPSQISVLSDDVTETAAKRSKSLDKKCDVLDAIAQRLTKTEPTDVAVNEQLATLVNGLMFKLKKPEESKLKEEGEKILRPQNCESLVVTKVDELIWNRLRPNTRSFDSRVQTAQGMLIKGVIEVTKMLNEMLDLKSKANDESVNDSIDYESKLNQLIDKGMSAIEMLSYANFEINMRRRECIKPDLNEDYQTSLFSSSVPVNNFLFGGDTSKRLEDIDKTNRAVKKAMVKPHGQSSRKRFPSKQYGRSRGYRGNDYKYSRSSHSANVSSSRKPFLGKRLYNQQEKKGRYENQKQ